MFRIDVDDLTFIKTAKNSIAIKISNLGSVGSIVILALILDLVFNLALRHSSINPGTIILNSIIIMGIIIRTVVTLSKKADIKAVTTENNMSIFTGLPPFKIGMGTNNYHKFSPDIETYVKILKNNGYKTYATAPSVAKDFGLTYDFENDDSTYHNYLSLFDGLGEQIIEKLSNDSLNTPWFFYIHIFDLHAPITIPKSFSDKKFGSSKYEKQISAIDFWIGKIIGKINFRIET